MKTMKKIKSKWLILGLILVVSMAFMVGCGDGNDDQKNGTPTMTQDQENGGNGAANGNDGSSETEDTDSQKNTDANSSDGSNDVDADGTNDSDDSDGGSGGSNGGSGDSSTDTNEDQTGQQDGEPTTTAKTCTLQINCSLLLDKDLTGTGLESLVSSSGVILAKTKVTIKPGDTVYDITLRTTQAKKIHFATQGSASLGTLYVEAIHNIYEKAYNSKSGWVYLVNGTKPGISSGLYEVKAGDALVWAYSCDLGNDL